MKKMPESLFILGNTMAMSSKIIMIELSTIPKVFSPAMRVLAEVKMLVTGGFCISE